MSALFEDGAREDALPRVFVHFPYFVFIVFLLPVRTSQAEREPQPDDSSYCGKDRRNGQVQGELPGNRSPGQNSRVEA
jgi:hypothetical protein